MNPSFSLIQIGVGFGLALVISLAAYALRSLSRSGALAATLLGTAVFGLGGLPWAVLLLGFFISSSLLSRLFRRRKQSVEEKFSKGSRRDAAQVAANGGIAGLLALIQVIFPASPVPWLAAAAALAAANADTWATELGVLSPLLPRLITTGKVVEKGTSGGLTPLGTLAALGGAAWIALLAVLFPPATFNLSALFVFGLVTLAGLLGSLIDSLLGATVQAIYTCPQCAKETERHPLHSCGTPTRLVRGWRWLDNDGVNAACTLSAAGIAALCAALLLPMAISPAHSLLEGGGSMKISSPAFSDGASIPARFTCQGENLSPQLDWSGVPPAAKSLALVVSDPDAPGGTFIHWVLYNLPPQINGLGEGIPASERLSSGAAQGRNDFGRIGYGGPCPPPGKPHRYIFTLYALDLAPDLPAGLNAARLHNLMRGHILEQVSLTGLYQR
ncbi:MAG: YbhB/YbcL family Raf kinase inhibitor-like protein [Chloroflexota bacterium]